MWHRSTVYIGWQCRAAGADAGLHGRGSALRGGAQAIRQAHRRVSGAQLLMPFACSSMSVMHAALQTMLLFALQLVQGKLADMYTVTQATRALLYRTAAQADAGQADRKDCAAVILYAAEHATRMALDAIQLLGGNGYIQVSLLSRADAEDQPVEYQGLLPGAACPRPCMRS